MRKICLSTPQITTPTIFEMTVTYWSLGFHSPFYAPRHEASSLVTYIGFRIGWKFCSPALRYIERSPYFRWLQKPGRERIFIRLRKSYLVFYILADDFHGPELVGFHVERLQHHTETTLTQFLAKLVRFAHHRLVFQPRVQNRTRRLRTALGTRSGGRHLRSSWRHRMAWKTILNVAFDLFNIN